MVRLFVALALPEAVKAELAGLVGGIPGAKWLPPANYHMTLRFIGEIQSWQAQDVDHALAAIRARPFEISLHGLGTFEKAGRLQALWVGIERSAVLTHLQNKVENALQRADIAPERKRFAPHVTLARVDRAPPDKVIGFVQAHNLFRAPPITIKHFSLFSSQLGKEHSVYTQEADYALA